MRRICFVLAVCTAVVALPVGIERNAHAMSYYEPYDVVLGAVRGTFSLDMWHYSGGYWMVDDGLGNRVKVLDRDMGRAGVSGTLGISQSARWSVVLPKAVRDAALNGKKIKTKLEFNSSLIKEARCEVSPTGSAFVYAKPVFHVSTSATLNSFVPGIAATIPLVDRNYGCNLYALYWMNAKRMTASGLFVDSSPSRTFEPYMHPAFIINSQGTIRPGLRIKADGKEYDSGLLSVGSLTLERGGAVGLRFDYPIKITFYAEELREVTKEEPPKEEVKPGGGEGTVPAPVPKPENQEPEPTPKPGGTDPDPSPKPGGTDPTPTPGPGNVESKPTPAPGPEDSTPKPGSTNPPTEKPGSTSPKPTPKPNGTSPKPGGSNPPGEKPAEPPDTKPSGDSPQGTKPPGEKPTQDSPPGETAPEDKPFNISDFQIHRVY